MSVVRSELLSTLRLFRFWIVVLLLSGAVFAAYVLSCLVYVNIAPFNISFVGGTPKYLLGNLDPTYFLFFQAGVLLLTFDHRQRIQRNRILEVIESRPVSNLQYQLGRALCYAGLIWAIIFVNVLFMQLIALVSQLFQFDIANTIQLHSMFNLLVVDAPVALLFWTTVLLLLSHVLRLRILVLFTSLFLMLAYYVWVLNTPFSFVDLLSHSSNQTLFISDILPALPSTTSWIMRAGVLLSVVALTTLGALFYRRSDSTNKVWTQVLPLTSLLLSGLVLTTGVLYKFNKTNELRNWQEAHIANEWNADLDIQAIHGEVEINPSKQMKIDVSLDFTLTSVSPVRSLVFTLNPGYQITSIQLDETPCEFEFNHGILEISLPLLVEPETQYALKLQATGKPNPHFAYINAPYDYLKDANFPIQAIHSFGTDGAVYNRKFVALMPGVYWYPVPGSIPRAADDDLFNGDFFHVELQVQLHAAPSWKVVGPGTAQSYPDEPSLYQIKPNIPVASIGLFASEFVRVSHDFQHIELDLYIHSSHAKQIQALGEHRDNVLEKIQNLLNDLNEEEISSPFDTIAFVEVPNQLRTVGGGWHMDRLNSLPGLVLLKEIGFPTINIDHLVNHVEHAYAGRENISNWVWLGLRNATEDALANDNVFDAFQDQSWKHLVSVSGDHRMPLDLVFRTIYGTSNRTSSDELFSIFATAQTTRMTGVNLPAALGFDRNHGSGMFDKDSLSGTERVYQALPAIWDRMERTALPSLNLSPESYQRSIEVLLFKSKMIADAFRTYYRRSEGQKFDRWLISLRQEFAGQQFTYDDATVLAKGLGIDITFLLNDWLVNDGLAGFEASRGSTIEIAPNEDGLSRYLFSFEIANTQPTAGYVDLLAPSRRVFALAGNTAKSVSFIWEASSSETSGLIFSVDTALSLNRGPIGFFLPTQDIPIDVTITPDEKVETSDFVPEQNGIIVDDLDAGFVVHQPDPFHMKFQFAPREWFFRNMAQELFDGTLPDVGSSTSLAHAYWARRSEPNAYGRYRRTAAMSRVGHSMKLHPVRFIAEIPESGRWSLDFHAHRPHGFWSFSGIENFNIEVENGSERWIEEFEPNVVFREMGWKTIGEFDLDAGRTDVVIVGTTKPSIVYADAIRWRKNKKQE